MACQQMGQGLRGDNSGKSNFQNRKIPEEEIHWSLQPVVYISQGDNHSISSNCGKVGKEKDDEEQELQYPNVRETKKYELADSRFITFHGYDRTGS